jgi:hypothetical protein
MLRREAELPASFVFPRLHLFGDNMRIMLPVVLLGCVLVGCGSPPPSPVVRGKVTMNGEPVAAAQVQLVPKGAPGATYSSTTKPDGSFEIRPTNAEDRPVAEGKYAVVVTKNGSPKGCGADEMTLVNVLPPNYADAAKTPLRIDVKAGDNQLEPFDLTTSK